MSAVAPGLEAVTGVAVVCTRLSPPARRYIPDPGDISKNREVGRRTDVEEVTITGPLVGASVRVWRASGCILFYIPTIYQVLGCWTKPTSSISG